MPVNHFRPGRNALAQLNALVDQSNRNASPRRDTMRASREFWARLVAPGATDGTYTFRERFQAADGTWADVTDGRGTDAADLAEELNGAADLAAGVIVRMREGTDDGGAVRYWFAAPPAAGGVAWAVAASNWVNPTDATPYVTANPCDNAAGANPDTQTNLTIYLPRAPGTDPNVIADQVIAYTSAGGERVAVSGYLDDAIGTIRLWAMNTGDPPDGWTECIPGGTYGHGSPRVEHLKGRFPVGRDTADEDLDAVDKTGGAAEHCHTLLKDNETDTCSIIQINEGQWESHIIGIVAADGRPPFCVVRFIERVDNSLPT